jgi:hypothetical protein
VVVEVGNKHLSPYCKPHCKLGTECGFWALNHRAMRRQRP